MSAQGGTDDDEANALEKDNPQPEVAAQDGSNDRPGPAVVAAEQSGRFDVLREHAAVALPSPTEERQATSMTAEAPSPSSLDYAACRALFKGVAVVIDDQIDEPESEISKIILAIRADGGHVVALSSLPEADDDLANFAGASFFIMDWQLEGNAVFDEEGEGAALQIPAGLGRDLNDQKLAFINKLAQRRFAPLFIFTTGSIVHVQKALKRDATLKYDHRSASHILVKSKDDVLTKGVFVVLSDWLNTTPSALVLKTWEREYEAAKNAMFYDFYTKSVQWPVMLWKTFKSDGLPASDELGRLITRIIFSRMTPFDLDLEPFLPELEAAAASADANGNEEYRKKLLSVLEAERFVPNGGLHPNSIAPGDVFKTTDGKYFINIRPECDCIPRDGDPDIDLYLLKGKPIPNTDLKKVWDQKFGTLRERDTEAMVFCMFEGKSFVFNFQELEIKKSGEILPGRIGRLLSPFLTRLQQRYASYLQRPGLPKIPLDAIPPTARAAAI